MDPEDYQPHGFGDGFGNDYEDSDGDGNYFGNRATKTSLLVQIPQFDN
jgi:hypothetical protein